MSTRERDAAAPAQGELMAVVSGYTMYLLASAAFDRRQCEGVVALRDLPSLMKEANSGQDCQATDVDFVVDCCASSLNGSVSALSREELSGDEDASVEGNDPEMVPLDLPSHAPQSK